MRAIIPLSGLVLALGVAGSAAAWAQSNPSADSIVNSLRPGGGLMGGNRGIRPAGPAPEASPATPAATAPGRPAAPAVSRCGPGSRCAPMAPTTAPASAPAAASAAPSTGATMDAPSVNLSVQFANGSAELTPAAMRTLDELGRALSNPALTPYRFRIEGHTDTVGTPDANKVLSDARARAVVEYLHSRYHVEMARLEAVGMGQDSLLIPTGPQRSEPRNRRVQVVNIGT